MDLHGRLTPRGLWLAAALLVPAGLAAQTPRDTACARDLRVRAPGVRVLEEDGCRQLAVFVVDGLSEGFYRASTEQLVAPRDLQSTTAGDAAPAGSPAQGEAVPTIQPMALGGGTVSAVGTDAGADAITAVTLNPAMFFTDPASLDAASRISRVADLTVFFPVNGLDQDGDGTIDYFGARARVNLTGLSRGDALLREVERQAKSLIRQELTLAESLAVIFQTAPALGECAGALLSTELASTVRDACGRAPSVSLRPAEHARFLEAVGRAREQADARYFGLDLRLDQGDPTLGAVAHASGTALSAALAFGRRSGTPGSGRASTALKGRLGVRYVALEDTSVTDFAVEGGLAFEALRPVQDQHIELSMGVEFRFSGAEDMAEPLQTRVMVARGALSVPIVLGASLAVNIAAPLVGDASPVLSINLNWGLLLAGLPVGR